MKPALPGRMRTSLRACLVGLVSLSVAPFGCSPADDGDNGVVDDGRADGQNNSVCLNAGLINDASGTRRTAKSISQNGDPIARLVLNSGNKCAATLTDTINTIRQAEASACDPNSGFQMGLVSETAQLTGVDDASYRGVIVRGCGQRPVNKLFFSPLDSFSAGKKIPVDSEIIAFDDSAGVFNYYALEGGQWNFHGNSIDMLQGPASGGKRRCAACHTGGGLIMKEFHSPWVNWDGLAEPNPNVQTLNVNPNSTKIVQDIFGQLANGKLGGPTPSKFLGATMQEQFVEPANQQFWDPTRLKTARDALGKDASATAELLKPLFCTVEMNLLTAGENNQRGITSIPSSFFVDGQLGFAGLFGINPAAYLAELATVNQRVSGAVDRNSGQVDDSFVLSKGGQVLREVAFGFIFPERSGSDTHFVEALLRGASPNGFAGATDGGTAQPAGQSGPVIDEAFKKAVLLTDFTRPVYSGGADEMRLDSHATKPALMPGRCELRNFAPVVQGNEPNLPEVIRTGFRMNLEAKNDRTAIEEEFLTNLKRTDLGSGTPKEVTDFAGQCAMQLKNDPKGLLHDLERVASVQRRIIRRLKVVENMALIPGDDLNEQDLDLRLQRSDCRLPK
jgi:hypothetical protein